MIDINKLKSIDKSEDTSRNIDINNLAKADIPESKYVTPSTVGEYFDVTPGSIKEYSPYFSGTTIPMWHGTEALNEARARNQTAGQLWKGMADQIVMGTIVGGTIEHIGSLMQIPQALKRWINYTDDEWQENFLQASGRATVEAARERSPIHQTQRAMQGGVRGMGDRTWWASHIPSVASSLAIIAPTRAATMLTMKLGKALVKGMKIKRAFDTAKAFKAAPWYVRAASSAKAKNMTETLVSSLYSRHIDSTAESMDTYRRDRERYKALGIDDDKAHEAAAKSANYNYRMGYLNLWKDYLAWGMLLGKSHAINRGFDARKAALLGKTKYKGQPIVGQQAAERLAKTAGYTGKSTKGIVGDWLSQGLLEGFEEYNIEWQKKEASRRGDIKAGLEVDDNSWIDRMVAHTKDPHTFDTFFWGTIGGLIFGSVGQYGLLRAEQGRNKKAQEAGNVYIKELENIININRKALEILDKGDDITSSDLTLVDSLGLAIESHLLQGGLMRGDLGVTIELLNNLSEMSDANLTEWGAQAGSQARFKQMAENMQVTADNYNVLADVDFGYGKEDTYIHSELASIDYQLRRLRDQREEYQNTGRDNRFDTIDFGENNEMVRNLIERKERLNSYSRNIIQTKELIKNLENDISTRDNQIKELNKQREVLRNNGIKGKRLESITDKLSKLELANILDSANIDKAKSDINILEKATVESDSLIKVFEDTINKIEDSEKKNEIKSFIDSAIKAREESIKNGTSELYNHISQIDTKIEKLKKRYDKLYTDPKAQSKFIDKINEVNKARTNKYIKETEDFIDSLSTDTVADIDKSIESLNKFHEDIGKDNDTINKAIKKKLKALESLKKKIQADESFTTNYNTVRDHLLENKDISELSEELQTFYKNNKKNIDEEVKKINKDRKDKANKKGNHINQIIKDETLLDELNSADIGIETFKAQLNIILDNNVSVLPYSKVKNSFHKPELYSNTLSLYVQALSNNNNSLIEDIYSNIPNLISDIFGQSITFEKLSIISNPKENKAETLEFLQSVINSNKYSPDTSVDTHKNDQYYSSINLVIEEFSLMVMDYNTYIENNNPDTTDSDATAAFNELSDTWSDIANNIPDPTAKRTEDVAKDLTDAMHEYANLVSRLINSVVKYYGNKDINVGVMDIVNLFTNNESESIIVDNWIKFVILFDSIKTNPIFAEKGKVKDGVYTAGNLKIDFSVPSPYRSIEGIKDYISNYKNRQFEKAQSEGTHIYLHDIINLDPNRPLSEEEINTLNAFLDTTTGDILELEYQPEWKYEGSGKKYSTPEERNNNPLTIPIAIKKNGVRIGFIQEIPMEHNGVMYMKDGKFRAFSAHIPDTTYELLANSQNQKELRQFFKKEIAFKDISSIELRNAIDDMANFNSDTDTKPRDDSRRHVIAPIFYDYRTNEVFNIEALKNKYKSHANRFEKDHIESKNTRELLAKNPNTVLKVNTISSTVRYGAFVHSLADRVAPINIDGENRIVILNPDINVADVSMAELIDIATGEPNTIPISNEKRIRGRDQMGNETRQPLIVHNVGTESNPIYQASYGRTGMLGDTIVDNQGNKSDYNLKIREKLINTLQQLTVGKMSLEQYKQFTKDIAKVITYNNFEAKSKPSFNFIFNRYSNKKKKYDTEEEQFKDSEFSIEFNKRRVDNSDPNIYAVEIKAKPTASGIVYTKAEFTRNTSNINKKENRVFTEISKQEAIDLLKHVKRSFKLDKKNNKLEEGPFVDPITKQQYNSYYDYIINTHAITTNVDAMLDTEGKPITNRVPNSGSSGNPSVIIGKAISPGEKRKDMRSTSETPTMVKDKLEIPYKTVKDGSGRMVTVTISSSEKKGFIKTTFKTETTNKQGEPRTQNDKGYNTFEEAVDNLDIDLSNTENESALELIETLKKSQGKESLPVRVVEIRESTDKSSSFYGRRVATILIGGEKIDVVLKSQTPTTTSTNPVDRLLGKSLNEIAELTDKRTTLYLIDRLKDLGIDIKINDKLNNQGQASWSASTNTISFSNNFRNKKDLNETLAYIKLDHELIHAILDTAESRMTDEQRDSFYSSIRTFVTELKEAGNNTLKGEELKIFNNAIDVIQKEMDAPIPNYQEVFAYAFGNEFFPILLSKIDGSNTVKEGFWSKLYEIIKKTFNVFTDNNKLGELAGILDNMLSDGITYNNEILANENDINNSTIESTEDTGEINNNNNDDFDDNDLFDIDIYSKQSVDITAENFYHTNKTNIIKRYGDMSMYEFIDTYKNLNSKQLSELFCI